MMMNDFEQLYKYKVQMTSKFKREYKLSIKRGYDIRLIDEVIKMLANDILLPEKYEDHNLTSNWKGYRECHVTPDWLLIYKKEKDKMILLLTRTGTHSDLDF